MLSRASLLISGHGFYTVKSMNGGCNTRVAVFLSALALLVVLAMDARAELSFMPRASVMRRLRADPRCPALSCGYRHAMHGSDYRNTTTIDVGDAIPLLGRAGAWDVSIEGGVFSIFDQSDSSLRLINADYLVATPVAIAAGAWTGVLRPYHQSSHMGDELIVSEGPGAWEYVSHEGLDVLLSHASGRWRWYGGAGRLLPGHDPAERHPLYALAGVEFAQVGRCLRGWGRVVAYLHARSTEENRWNPEISLMAGLELKSPTADAAMPLQLLASYYDGDSVDGRFYDQHVRHVGIAIRLLRRR